MMNAKNSRKSVRYASIHINNAATKYTLHVNGFTGTLFDALEYYNRQKFSTIDSVNDSASTDNCASLSFVASGFTVTMKHILMGNTPLVAK